MDIDFDVPKFLREERDKAPKELQHYFIEFEDLYDRKLWHQLTQKVLEFFKFPESEPFQLPLFQHFVDEWKNKMNTLSLVSIALQAASRFREIRESVEFLGNIITKVDKPDSKDAYVMAVMETANFKLRLDEMDEVQKAINESEAILDKFDSVETVIYASFYRVSAAYYKAKADYGKYYKNALLFLACVNIDELPQSDKIERAYDMALSALMSDTIYNFGELLMHPILDSLTGTEHDWLRSLLFAFNSGDIGKFEALIPHFSKQPLLEQNNTALRRKICLMSLIEFVFRGGTGGDRAIPFNSIAAEARLPLDEVEDLVMKALSLKLIRGSIDQVDQVVYVVWVQPRVLDRDQIKGMKDRLESWNKQVNNIHAHVREKGGDVYA